MLLWSLADLSTSKGLEVIGPLNGGVEGSCCFYQKRYFLWGSLHKCRHGNLLEVLHKTAEGL